MSAYSDIEQEIRAWAAAPRLQKALGTKIHHLRDAVRPEHFVNVHHEPGAAQLQKMFGTIIWDRIEGLQLQSFLVEHDWASVFDRAEGLDYGAQVRLPYPLCVFEFEISGRRVAVVANEFRDDAYRLMPAVECVQGWTFLNFSTGYMTAIRKLIEDSVRAICIALEAEVAETEVVRAPHKLNRARDRRGKGLVPDYRVVRLARRTRVKPLPQPLAEERRSVRLHFRRGHWRHFEHHKTWVKWTLVGDPDLGFIDKHYRL